MRHGAEAIIVEPLHPGRVDNPGAILLDGLMHVDHQSLFTTDPAQVAAHVEGLLARHLPDADAPWQAELISKGRHGGGALIFAARSERTRRKVAVKVYRQPHRALAEYRATRAAWKGPATVIRPLYRCAQQGVFVSEWVDGTTLSEALGDGTVEQALPDIGRWVKRFHAQRTNWPHLRSPSDVLVPLSVRAATWPGPLPSEEMWSFRRTVATVAQAAARMRTGLHRPVRLHGDLTPRNVILTPRGIVGLDLSGTRLGSAEEDLAKLTSILLLWGETATDARPFDGEGAREALLSGYGLISRRSRAWLGLWEAVEFLGRWREGSVVLAETSANDRGKAQAAKSILARRGWLVAVAMLIGEVDLRDERRLGYRYEVVAGAPA